jgi:folate-binding protein YgfZ
LSAFFSALNDEALLQVTGPDAATFLQGQTTCDLREVDAHRARPGAYCNPQGRVLADFLLAHTAPECYLLRLHASLAATTAERLARYVVFSKAEVSLASHWRVFACWGETVAAALLAITGDLPGECYACVTGEDFCLLQVDDDSRQFELYLDGDRRADLEQALSGSLTRGDQSVWRALQIDRGIARVESATVETFLPQALNYDRVGFVSFNKGCYTGQEVVARLHYRGQSKRRLYPASAPAGSSPVPAAGDPVYAGGGEQAVGTVVNAVGAEAADTRLLVSLAERVIDQPLTLDAEGTRPLRITVPPAAPEPSA